MEIHKKNAFIVFLFNYTSKHLVKYIWLNLKKKQKQQLFPFACL